MSLERLKRELLNEGFADVISEVGRLHVVAEILVKQDYTCVAALDGFDAGDFFKYCCFDDWG